MPHVNPNVLFQTGWSTSQKVDSSELEKYLKAFTALTTQVREDIVANANKSISLDEVSANHVIISTTVEVGTNSKLLMENCGNMIGILKASSTSNEIDDKTLAKLNALLQAAVDERLEVIYKEADFSSKGGKQELMILTNFGQGQPPKTTGVQALFDTETNTKVKKFTDEYKGKLQQIDRFWVNPATQDVESKVDDDKITTAKLPGLKDSKKGSADDEEQDDILDAKKARDAQGRVKDEAEKRRMEDERRKDREDIIEDRDKAFRDAKLKGKLDQASQRAHGESRTTD